jgi:hypothetical protein
MGDDTCRIVGCENPRDGEAWYCAEHQGAATVAPESVMQNPAESQVVSVKADKFATGCGCLIIVALALALVFGVKACASSPSPPETPPDRGIVEVFDDQCPEGTIAHLVDQGNGAFIQCY